MKVSEYFLPTIKEAPTEAKIISHQLMLRSGMIKQSSAGIYSWLPLGLRVLRKIENLVRDEQNKIGCQEILMPTIQPADIWKESGRYNEYGKEMLRITDRNNRELLYGPTNEELITDIFRNSITTYKQLPKLLYHMQWKFRDEVRPRYGIMRGREFLMKDAYSFDLESKSARLSYFKMFFSYLRTFSRLGLTAIPMKADPGPIGGDLSHEFVVLAPNGESNVFFDRKILSLEKQIPNDNFLEYEASMELYSNIYAATDDMYDKDLFNKKVPLERQCIEKGIEVGHVFYFGEKYSKSMKASVINSEGKEINVHMGSYGIGISRLVGAIIESSYDEDGIIWPVSIAPFKVGLMNLRVGDKDCDKACNDLYKSLNISGVDVIFDDRNESAGVKFSNMDLIGIPYQVAIGPRGLKENLIDIKERATGKRYQIPLESIIPHLT
ncbi:proline--tRNA ligase [Alphaproteobacteria bacterium]|nr:proline--tRNA ligase [Alphaproteobacteria bacterium]